MFALFIWQVQSVRIYDIASNSPITSWLLCYLKRKNHTEFFATILWVWILYLYGPWYDLFGLQWCKGRRWFLFSLSLSQTNINASVDSGCRSFVFYVFGSVALTRGTQKMSVVLFFVLRYLLELQSLHWFKENNNNPSNSINCFLKSNLMLFIDIR